MRSKLEGAIEGLIEFVVLGIVVGLCVGGMADIGAIFLLYLIYGRLKWLGDQ